MNAHGFFNQLAAEEDPLAFRPEHLPQIEQLRQRLGALRGKRILEPGCGAGPLTEYLAQWVGEGGQVVAFDPCAGMVEKCARRLADFPQVRVLQASGEDVSFPAQSFDFIICFRVYPHLDNPAVFLAGSREWLAPDGQLIVVNLEGSRELNAMHEGHAGVHDHRMPDALALTRTLEAHGWIVAPDAVDKPTDYFVRARR